jgi:hypothetical protein
MQYAITAGTVRVFDIALWFSHPAVGVDGVAREITVQLRD